MYGGRRVGLQTSNCDSFAEMSSDVVKAKISRPRPRPHPSRPRPKPGPSRPRPRPRPGQGQGHSPKAFKHTATTEIKICSTSDSLTG